MSDPSSTERDAGTSGSSSSTPPASPPSSSSLLLWVRAGIGGALTLAVVVRLIPVLVDFLREARHAPCGGWEKWVPAAAVGVVILAVGAPSSFKDLLAVGRGLLGRDGK